ncbi:hypothetical protein RJT34_00257 [Clitoria ternatea]|uniref:UvrD-like helicase ATP-binding domain-containing protein n=1 Tax=Clitoria ternatea TaxID=43366 RepID=A0AAN9KI81_CLITE
MMQVGSSSKNRATHNDYGFMDQIFSWSIEDIINEDLYNAKVEEIKLSFQSIDDYRASYVYPLLEETRAQLCSSMDMIYQAPFAEVIGLEVAEPHEEKMYNLGIHSWKNRFSNNGEPYKMLPGDVFLVADFRPETARDLRRDDRMWSFVSVVTEEEFEGDGLSVYLKVKASKYIDPNQFRQKSLFFVFLTNVSSNSRIWGALHMTGNLKLINRILGTSDEVEECCGCAPVSDALRLDSSYRRLSSDLNESQSKAISACLSGLCSHNSTIKLIWGPPGTGKTKTLATLLFGLLKMKYRILVCAPTNVAIKEVASRVLSIVRKSLSGQSGDCSCSIGDMLLFGSYERLQIGEDVEDIYLNHRVKEVMKCFAPSSGWRYCLKSMTYLLKHCVSRYREFIEDVSRRDSSIKAKSFLDFLRERFRSTLLPLKSCISILCTHISMCQLFEHNHRNLVRLNKALESFQDCLFQDNFLFEGLERLFSSSKMISSSFCGSAAAAYQLFYKRKECLDALRTVKDSLDSSKLKKSFNKSEITEFCFQNSSLIFCTTSASYRLHSIAMKPPNILVIDEAAQLKECESLLPMLLPEISHAILVGDECQLSSMVRSNVSQKAGLGRSLFQRLSTLDYPKHLLNIQHRMHPKISSFPNKYFYFNKILDASNVERDEYGKQYLPGPMFGPYSFINVIGKEQLDDAGRSFKNMAEVAVIMTILKNLHQEWFTSRQKLSIGIVSPYAGQVAAIQKKLGQRYENYDGFSVNVKTIDGFQGGEHDVIILSTVRTNNSSSLKFIASPQRTNVALTRARYCLWILGNERTLTSYENVWKAVVLDAKSRNCFFNADHDKEFAKVILDAQKETDPFDNLLDTNSEYFKNIVWKIHFTDKFRRSFKRLRSEHSKHMVLNLLQRICTGWRPKRFTVELSCENSSQILKQFKVENRNMEFPLSWPLSANIKKNRTNDSIANDEGDLNVDDGNGENLESILLMKYCSISRGYMLFGYGSLEVGLPYEVTKEQENIILFPRSTFVLGRSGTGKTTVLITKLIQNEKLHHMAVEEVYDGSYGYEKPVLRQLFVTLSPGLCQKVQHHVSLFKRSLCKGTLAETSSVHDDIGNTSPNSGDIPHSFKDIPSNLYPLVVTFRKFLLMLDETLGNSYFERFYDHKVKDLGSRRDALRESFILRKEVNYERFDSLYWPHFNIQLTKKLDSYQVFTEIMSHIKGGTKASEHGRLSLEDYCTLSESRVSSLCMSTRVLIYDVFQNYEKMKKEKGEFDFADVVFDLHSRLRSKRYKADEMHFVYIDEVQDLTMAQIELFKYICKNVEEGYVFCGDTAQTVGRGIDFRFQDVRSLFYKKFVLECKNWNSDKRKEKGIISDILVLSQNFCTSAQVLKVSQSIIDVLFHFFPHSVDMLKVETSLIEGEVPLVMVSRNLIQRLMVDVILVRDGNAREEIKHIVGKQTLVLTIVECKGFDFQDVLLYNFFASSPLKRRWGKIYEFMKEKHMLDSRTQANLCKNFDDSKHYVLCSELKQLYVALTRARRKLYICEDADEEDFSRPMLDYWKKMNLVQCDRESR